MASSFRKIAFSACMIVFMAFSGTAHGADITTPQTLRIQAIPIGSSWYLFGATFSKMLQDNLPQGSIVDVVAKGGAIANYLAADQGKVEAAITNQVTAIWGWNGDDVYKGKKSQNARAIAGGLNNAWVMVLARTDFLKKNGLNSLDDILTSGKPVRWVMKPVGSAPVMMADKIFAAMDTSVAKIKKDGGNVVYVGVDQITSMIRDGLADVYIEIAIRNNPAISEIALTTDVTFLDLPQKFLDQEVKGGLVLTEMPVMFKGQTKAIKTFDMGAVLVVNKNISDDLAYLMAKTFTEKKADLAAASKAWENLDPQQCCQPENTGIPLHPGAERYYKERGWLK
ncbi:MAG: hypothetical protein DELT_00809 [Desulfovibrio sp.]